MAFLGYIVAQGHLEMDPAKVGAVTSWLIPETHKQLQRFLGFTNFFFFNKCVYLFSEEIITVQQQITKVLNCHIKVQVK